MEFQNITRILSLYARESLRQRFIPSHFKLKDLEIFWLAVLGNGKILKSDARHFIGLDFVWFYLIEISHLQRDSDSLRTFYATSNIKFHTFTLKDLEI